MDKEQARFLLRSFRPDGADAGSEDFAEALLLAAEDRELGEWLAQERADDAAFAKALNQVPIPASLREEILSVLEYDGQDMEHDGELEGLFMGGLNAIDPPAGLRDQILASMEVEKAARSTEVTQSNVTDIAVWRWLSVSAAAAAISVGFFVLKQNELPRFESSDGIAAQVPKPVIGQPAIRQVAVHNATLQVAAMLTAPETLDLKTDLGCTLDAMDFLKSKKSPVPTLLPPGLEEAKLVGCRDIFLDDGQPVSLLCFEKEGVGMVHLISIETKRLSDAGDFSSMKNITLKNCTDCRRTNFNIAHWNEGDMTYMILTKAEKKKMVKLF